MGERKVSCKYIPSDFDPSKPGRRSKPKNGQHDVRFMLPMAIQCTSCGDYMFQGTKANSRKELVYNEFYLGVPVYRFYIHCKNCYAEITIKTDPKNSDYVVEQGAIPVYEPYKKIQQANIEEQKMKLQGNNFEVLERDQININHDIKQTEELERLVEAKHKHKKVRKKDLIKLIKQQKYGNQNLAQDDIQRLNEFEAESSKVVLEKPRMKKSIHLNSSAFSKPSGSLLSYDSD